MSEIPTPVLICARNEENDLPRTLKSLAASTSMVEVFVVDNGSQDNTAEIAEKWGAIVISEPTPGRMVAFKTGLSHIASSYASQSGVVLCADADTRLKPGWGESMASKANTITNPRGGIVAGGLRYSEGILALNAFKTLAFNSSLIGAKFMPKIVPPFIRGANMAIKMDEQWSLAEDLCELPDNVWPQESLIRDTILQRGGTYKANLSPRALAYVRDDRIVSLGQYWEVKTGKVSPLGSYGQEYPNDDMARYVSTPRLRAKINSL